MSEVEREMLYISGGIAGVPDFEERFATAERDLMAYGFQVVNPVKLQPMCEGCGDSQPGSPWEKHLWECFLRWDLIALLWCDGVALLSGWESSKGATLEFTTARSVGLECKPVRRWIDGRRKS